MLNNISWQGYWTFLALTTTLYYAFILLFFHRKEWIGRFQRRFASLQEAASTKDKNEQLSLFQPASNGNAAQEDGPEYLPAVHSLVDEVHAFFESQDATTCNKGALLAALKHIIRKYPSVRGTAYQHSVSNLIVFLSEQNCSLHLSAEEAGGVWL